MKRLPLPPFTTWVSGLAVMASTAVVQAARTADDQPALRPKTLLQSLCQQNTGEPVCGKQGELSEDQAWLVVWHACGLPNSGADCAAFRQQLGPVLRYDAAADTWQAEWESRLYPLTFDVVGTPTLRLQSRTAPDLKVVVDNISPLVYSAKAGTPKEEDLAVIAGLKTFLALAGTGLQGLVQTLAFSSPITFGDVKAITGSKAGDAAPLPPCVEVPPDVEPLASLLTERLKKLSDLHAAMRGLEREIDKLEKVRSGFLRAVQQIEDGATVHRDSFVAPDQVGLERAFTALDAAADPLVKQADALNTCGAKLGAYVTLLGAPNNAAVVKAFAAQVNNAGCGVPALDAALNGNADILVKACADKLAKTLELHRDALKPIAERLYNAGQMEEKVWQAVDKVRASRKDVMAGSSVLARQVKRGLESYWRGTLIRQLVVTRPNPELSWSKVQSHSIEVKAESPYLKELTLTYGTEAKHAYKLESATGQILGYGIGMVYTPLHESTFGAVAVPGTDTKIIAETERETRAGDLVAFLSYRFLEHSPPRQRAGATRPSVRRVQPTLDVGVGLTSDRPAFFVGVGVEVRRAARIGFGWSAQRVSVLADGQIVGDVVESNDDIKTEKRFDTSHYYISVTFALDALSLFNGK